MRSETVIQNPAEHETTGNAFAAQGRALNKLARYPNPCDMQLHRVTAYDLPVIWSKTARLDQRRLVT